MNTKHSYGQNNNAKIEDQLSLIQELSSANKVLEQLQLMIKTTGHISDSDFSAALRTQYIYRLSSIPIDLDLLVEQADTNNLVIGKAYEFDGTRKLLTGAYEDARISYQTAKDLISPYGGEHTVLRWLGIVNGVLENFTDCISNYEEGIIVAKNYFVDASEKKFRFLSRMCINLSSTYTRTFNLRKAKYKALEALDYLDKANDESLYATAKVVLAQAELNLHNFDNALVILDSIQSYISDDHPIAMNFFNTKANVLLQMDRCQEAIINFEKANTLTNSVAIKKLNIGGIGESYLGLKKYDEAISSFTTLIDYYQDQGSGFTSSYVQTLNRRAQSHLGNEDLKKANKDVKKALKISYEYETLKIINHATLTRVYAKLYEQTQNDVFIDSIYSTMLRNDSIITYVREKHRYFEDAMELNSHVNEAYAENLKSLASVGLTNKTDKEIGLIFKYFEGMKAYSLKELLKTDDAVQIGNIPEHVLDEEKQWKLKLSDIQKELYQAEQGAVNSSIDSLNKVFLLEKENYFTFLNDLEKEYPNYYRFQYADTSPKLQDIQNVLDEDDLVIEYFLDDESIYTLTIAKNEVNFYTKIKDQNWDATIEKFRDATSNVSRVLNQDQQDELFEDFTKMASYLYQELLANVLIEQGEDKHDLIIVPDDELNVIPFEILLRSNSGNIGDYSTLDYVLNDYNIAYEQTAMDLIMNDSRERKSNKYLGFAPSYQNDSSINELRSLPKAKSNIQQVAKLLDGEAFVDVKASKQNFLGSIETNNVLHFAMHAIVDQENPALSRLVFSDDLDKDLYATDIYDLQLRSDLAVLSACNTGKGKIINGDGVQNLARAFKFAGVQSIIMSLWSVPDEQTADINFRFFSNLKSGQKINEALKNAKLAYLSSAPTLGKHPFFWAGFVPSGDTNRAIDFSSNKPNILMYLIFGVALFILIYFLYRRINS